MARLPLLAVAVAAATTILVQAQKPVYVDLKRCVERPNEPLLLLLAEERVELRLRTVGPLYASEDGFFYSTLQALPWAWADVVISTHWPADGSKRAGAEVSDGVAATVGSVADLVSQEQQSYLWSWVSFLSDPLDMRGAAMKAIQRVRGAEAATWDAVLEEGDGAGNSSATAAAAGAAGKGSGKSKPGSSSSNGGSGRAPPRGVLSLSPFTPLSRWGWGDAAGTAAAAGAAGSSGTGPGTGTASSSSSFSSSATTTATTPVSLAYPRARLVAAAAASRSVHARARAAALPGELEVRCRISWVAPRYPAALAAGAALFANAHALAAHPATYYGGGFAAGVTLLAVIALVLLYRQRHNRAALAGAAALGATAATFAGFLQALGGLDGLAGLDAASPAAAACDPSLGPCLPLPQLASTASSLARAWAVLPYAALAALLLCGVLTVAALHCCKPAREVPDNAKEVLGYFLQAAALAALLLSSASLELSIATAVCALLSRPIGAVLGGLLRLARLFACCDAAIARCELAWDATFGRLPCCCRCTPRRPQSPGGSNGHGAPRTPRTPGGGDGHGRGNGDGNDDDDDDEGGNGGGGQPHYPPPSAPPVDARPPWSPTGAVQGGLVEGQIYQLGDGTFVSPMRGRDGKMQLHRINPTPVPVPMPFGGGGGMGSPQPQHLPLGQRQPQRRDKAAAAEDDPDAVHSDADSDAGNGNGSGHGAHGRSGAGLRHRGDGASSSSSSAASAAKPAAVATPAGTGTGAGVLRGRQQAQAHVQAQTPAHGLESPPPHLNLGGAGGGAGGAGGGAKVPGSRRKSSNAPKPRSEHE